MIPPALILITAIVTLSVVWTAPLAAQCTEFTAGEPDDFALPEEYPEPSDQFLSWATKFWIGQTLDRTFDVPGTDRALIHTFTGWKGRVCGASLEVRLRAGPSLLSDNDSIRLGLKGGQDPQAAWNYWVTIRRVLGSWGPGREGTVYLDLADLPVYGGFQTNMLEALRDRELEFMVEDDTAVDYATLSVCGCGDAQLGSVPATLGPVGPSSGTRTTWGSLKARYGGTE